MLPGCQFSISALTIENAGDVNSIVAYTYAITASTTVGEGNNAVTYNLNEMYLTQTGDNRVTIFELPAAVGGVYMLAPEDTINVPGLNLEINPNLGNYAWNEDGTVRFVLNRASDYAAPANNAGYTDVDLSEEEFELDVSVEVYAIQQHHVAEYDSTTGVITSHGLREWLDEKNISMQTANATSGGAHIGVVEFDEDDYEEGEYFVASDIPAIIEHTIHTGHIGSVKTTQVQTRPTNT